MFESLGTENTFDAKKTAAFFVNPNPFGIFANPPPLLRRVYTLGERRAVNNSVTTTTTTTTTIRRIVGDDSEQACAMCPESKDKDCAATSQFASHRAARDQPRGRSGHEAHNGESTAMLPRLILGMSVYLPACLPACLVCLPACLPACLACLLAACFPICLAYVPVPIFHTIASLRFAPFHSASRGSVCSRQKGKGIITVLRTIESPAARVV
ncbi:hypothetical protein G5I_08550 [Acromyrmex echinatior]|uniref:Uncharacterized protein n=1 Tax=Acromyrmex echinatior TaxID=103372 RepID=F4WRU6_ACREC|nr:hypothetical protein G5I_08550 [Acromyrmex echinatior]